MQLQTDVAQSPKVETREGRLEVRRFYTTDDQDVFDTVEWENRTAIIRNAQGVTIFEQKDVEFPKSWSQLATNVTVEKYFRGKLGTPVRETSLRQVIKRVALTITSWGVDQGYFKTPASRIFRDELTYILLHQIASFNSPVWFNLGVEGAPPQVSACFIQSVDDSMSSIMDLAKSEVMLFKGGSGTGTNLSKLRSSKEHLSGGGLASGPVSFMKGYDSFAGVTKSGGRTRRAAKMVMLDVEHPDILDFIRCKGEEEKKAHALIEAGWSGEWNEPGGAYDSVQYQNANNSVRVSDEFMQAAEAGTKFSTHEVQTGKPYEFHDAKEVLRLISEQAHFCGDPGVQFDTTINQWNTCANTGRINGSNPCSEYMHLDDSACNLASINLRKFDRAPNGLGWFDVKGFTHTVNTLVMAQDIMVKPASYPTESIGEGARAYRQLGLGYSNLGGLLMARGMPYDSWEGRRTAGYITDLMQATAYRTSAQISECMGPFDGYQNNAEPMAEVIDSHIRAHTKMSEYESRSDPHNHKTWSDLAAEADDMWASCRIESRKHGFRNAQVSVLAPTGTISFMMDCDTTGIEPDIGLRKFKSLAGGGSLTIVNTLVDVALANLGYDEHDIDILKAHIEDTGRVEGCEVIKSEHLAVFDCAFRTPGGTRLISPMGHIKMMAAVQPFLSGAISKTVNVDTDTTVTAIEELFTAAWKSGLKAIAIYRDGCKLTQPLRMTKDKVEVKAQPTRRRLDDEREAVCHKFSIGGHEGYVHVGLYDDGTVGEMFVRMAKEGSTISGMMDAFATAISIGVQYGVPLATFVEKFKHTRFEPSGFTQHADIRMAQSIIDYIFRWLELKFLEPDPQVTITVDPENAVSLGVDPTTAVFINQTDAPMCLNCGNMTVRNGSCHKCLTCGTSNGCS